MSVRSFQNNFWCSEEKHGLFLQILQMFYFICGIIWIADRFLLLVYMYLVIKNQSVWMLASCTKYQVFVSLCFSSMV